MNIRPETPADYAAIGDLHVRAFGRTEEAVIVPLLRQRRDFDPELSLVAEENGKIVGHALFSPYPNIILMNDNIRAVNLAPIGIEPNYQRQGIGRSLIEEGHRIAQSKGYSVSFLLGHDTYYPRFGYKIGAYGASSVELIRENLISSDLSLETRVPTQPDCTSLSGLMIHEEYRVDFAIVLSDSLLDWISPNPNIQSTVYLRDRAVVGYTRVHKDKPNNPRIFLAFDNKTAHTMTSMLMGDLLSMTLPLHPDSRSAEAFDVKPQVTAWNAAMACSLAPSPFDDYYAQLQEGKRLPGRIIWPVAFDLA